MRSQHAFHHNFIAQLNGYQHDPTLWNLGAHPFILRDKLMVANIRMEYMIGLKHTTQSRKVSFHELVPHKDCNLHKRKRKGSLRHGVSLPWAPRHKEDFGDMSISSNTHHNGCIF